MYTCISFILFYFILFIYLGGNGRQMHYALRHHVWDSDTAHYWAYSPIGHNALLSYPPTPHASQPGHIPFLRQYVPVGQFCYLCIQCSSFNSHGSVLGKEPWLLRSCLPLLESSEGLKSDYLVVPHSTMQLS